MKKIALLGSTGSIGQQTLDIIASNPDLFSVEVLTANNNVNLLIEQAMKFMPNVVIISNEEKYPEIKEALSELPIKVYAGCDAIAQVVEMGSIDTVVTAMVGFFRVVAHHPCGESRKTDRTCQQGDPWSLPEI